MFLKFLISILFAGLFAQACGQHTLIGNWRRVNPNLKYQDTSSKKHKWGDLQIRADSTFHLEGDSSTQNSTIPGWHYGDEYNGSWKLQDNNRLTLWLESKDKKMLLPFRIIELTTDKLVLRSTFNKNDKKHDIIYLRM